MRSRRAIWPVVGLVIVSGEMQKAVQDQHLDFGGKGMFLLAAWRRAVGI